jgi:hypothetical protein
MKGCISRDDKGEYVLVPKKGAKVVLSNSGDVAGHLGQQVKISGAFVNAKDPLDPSKPQTKAQVAHEFRVIKLDVLAQTCSATAKKKK